MQQRDTKIFGCNVVDVCVCVKVSEIKTQISDDETVETDLGGLAQVNAMRSRNGGPELTTRSSHHVELDHA